MFVIFVIQSKCVMIGQIIENIFVWGAYIFCAMFAITMLFWLLWSFLLVVHSILDLFGINVRAIEKFLEDFYPFKGDSDDSYGG